MGTNIFIMRLQQVIKRIDLNLWGKIREIEDQVFYGVYRDATKLYTRLTIEEALKKSEQNSKLYIKRETL